MSILFEPLYKTRQTTNLISEHLISFAFIKALLFISQVVYNTRGRVVLNIQSLALRAHDFIIQYNTAASVVSITYKVFINLIYTAVHDTNTETSSKIFHGKFLRKIRFAQIVQNQYFIG